MGTVSISLEHSKRLYWLGRYAERVMTTQHALLTLYDRLLDSDTGYDDYLRCFGIQNTFPDKAAFFRGMLYDKENPNSVAYSLERAYDNGIVLREDISTEALSFLQIAKDIIAKAASAQTQNPRLLLLPLNDALYAFWGCTADKVCNAETYNLIQCGKSVERLDLYLRLNYPYGEVEQEFDRLCRILRHMPKNTPYRYNTQYLSELVVILGTSKEYEIRRSAAIQNLSHLFDEVPE